MKLKAILLAGVLVILMGSASAEAAGLDSDNKRATAIVEALDRNTAAIREQTTTLDRLLNNRDNR